MFLGCCIEISEKPTLRRHRLDRIADLEVGVGPGRKGPAIDPFDADLQDTLVLARTDRIAAAQLGAVEIAAKRQVLALGEVERCRRAIDGFQRDHHRITDGVFNVGDFERVKAGHGASLLRYT